MLTPLTLSIQNKDMFNQITTADTEVLWPGAANYRFMCALYTVYLIETGRQQDK